MLIHIAAVLMTIAAALFVFAVSIVANGFNGGLVLSWDAPMPWAIVLALGGLAILVPARRMAINTEPVRKR